ncbi:MAG: hypothetical protein N2Z84_02045 [Atribacterota bacterium]|nr:hypothetical protein [Atribacterota bacterium]
MPRKTLTLFAIVAFAVFFSLLFAGCRIGLGIGVEARLGVIYFLSSLGDVYGELYVDGEKIGYIIPGEYLGKWVFLDFRHQVELRCGYCGATHSMVIDPPLYAGQVVMLDFLHE